MKKSIYFPLVGVATCGGLTGCYSDTSSPQPPNIVFILGDDIG